MGGIESCHEHHSLQKAGARERLEDGKVSIAMLRRTMSPWGWSFWPCTSHKDDAFHKQSKLATR